MGRGWSHTEESEEARLLAWRPGGWRDTKELAGGRVFRLPGGGEEGCTAPKPASPHLTISANTDLSLSQEEARWAWD